MFGNISTVHQMASSVLLSDAIGVFPATDDTLPIELQAPYTLVIVDMQPGFDASNHKPTIEACKRQILTAMQNGCPIVVLEMGCENNGQTHESLRQLLTGYDRFVRVSKEQSDGSRELLAACRNRWFPMHRFLVCGVNIHACVESTVRGLSNSMPAARIEVVKEACNDNWYIRWDRFYKAANVFPRSEEVCPGQETQGN